MMDALLTNFFSTAPIMVPPWAMEEESFVEQYFVELDLSQSLSNSMDYFATSLSISKGGNIVELTAEGYVGECYHVDCCERYHQCTGDSPFSLFFQHQRSHMAHNQRRRNALQTSNTFCSYFGKTNCCNSKFPAMSSQSMDVSCPCSLWMQDDSVCDKHGIIIQDVEKTVTSCTWYICFDFDDDSECFEEESDMVEDTFEIEFSSEMCLNNSFEITNVSFTHTSFLCDSSSEDDNDEDDDDEDDDDCSWAPTTQMNFLRKEMWSASKKTKPKNENSCSGAFRKNTSSKFHAACSHSHGNNNDLDNHQNQEEKTKKVHFPVEQDKLVQVKRLYAWPFASKQARKSVWMRAAQDRVHFHRRIEHKFSELLNPVLEERYAQFLLTLGQQ